MWPALGAVAIVAAGLTGVSGAWAAEPTPTAGTNSDAHVVLDNNSLWRHFLVSRCAYVRGDDGKLEPWDLAPLGYSGHWLVTLAPVPAATTTPSPLPPADWAGPDMDDGAWPRARLPQPTPTVSAPLFPGMRPQCREGGTAALLVRGKFEVKDPAQVKACRLSLDYWGGVVVYVNGKEAARGHVAGTKADILALADDYPLEAFTTPKGALRGQPLPIRNLREVGIPAALLRKGVNVLAIEVHASPAYFKGHFGYKGTWDGSGTIAPTIGLLNARLTVSPTGAGPTPQEVGTNGARPRGIKVWNCAAYDTVTAFDYGDPFEPLRPIKISAARNSVFSGRLMVGSDQPIKGLKATVSDLTRLRKSSSSSAKRSSSSSSNARVENEDDDEDEGGGGVKLPASAVRVRYAVPVTVGPPATDAKTYQVQVSDSFGISAGSTSTDPNALTRSQGKSYVAAYRFDGLLDAIPVEIPVIQARLMTEKFFDQTVDRKSLVPGAVAPLWFTVWVPASAGPGVYEGKVTIAAEGLAPTSVPLRVSVCDWVMPDPKDFRVHNLAWHSAEAVAAHYEVPLWSDKHFELMGQSHALMAEAGSRQVYAALGANTCSQSQGLIRWIKQPDGSYKHDFTIFDKYLDMVAKYVGKPLPLRLDCWYESTPTKALGQVSQLDPATGKIVNIPQPEPGTEESVTFWKPVFDEVLKKVKARGWLGETALGHYAFHGGPMENVADLAEQIWPEAVWAVVSHQGCIPRAMLSGDGKTRGWTDPNHWVKVLYGNTVYSFGIPTVRGYRQLLGFKPGVSCNTYRLVWNDSSSLTDIRRVQEDVIMSGHDGVSDFGVDLFGFKRPDGSYVSPYAKLAASGPGMTQMSLLYPGPDGPVATERYEMFREGVQLAEALIHIERAIQEKKLSPELQQKAEQALEARSQAFIMNWFTIRDMPGAEEDAKLLNLAGEVAREVEKK
jgi:hypothetical protein